MNEKDSNKDILEKEDETPSTVGVVDLHELITEQHSIG